MTGITFFRQKIVLGFTGIFTCAVCFNQKVSYHKQIPSKNFPPSWFDDHGAKIGCCFLYCVCVHVGGPKKLGEAGALPPCDLGHG